MGFFASLKEYKTLLRKEILPTILQINLNKDKKLETKLFATFVLAFLADEGIEIELDAQTCKLILQSIAQLVDITPITTKFDYMFTSVVPYLSLMSNPHAEVIQFFIFFLNYVVNHEFGGREIISTEIGIQALIDIKTRFSDNYKINIAINKLLYKLNIT